MPQPRPTHAAPFIAPLLLASFLATSVGPAVCSAVAQDAPKEGDEKRVLVPGRWYPSMEGGVTLTQSAYSDNWNGGDKGSIVWVANLNATAENQLSAKVNSMNTLKLAYGQTHQQKADVDGDRSWDRPDKSTDLIAEESVLRFTLQGLVDPYAAFNFESQFQDASDPLGRTLSLNPMKFKESVGVARQFINLEDRSLLSRLGFTMRQSVRKFFVEDAPSKTTASESGNDGGLEWVTEYKTKLAEKRVTWSSRLGVYQPFFYSGKDELEDIAPDSLLAAGLDPDVADFSTTVDVDFENIFTTQITKIISVNLYTRWVYDKYDNSVSPRIGEDGNLSDPALVRSAVRKSGQFKQTLGIGLTYRFI